MPSNNKKLTSIIIVNGKSADPSSPLSTHTRRYWLYCHFPVTLANAGPTLSHTTHTCCDSADFGKLWLIYFVRMRHCTGTDPTRYLVPVVKSGNNCLKSKWLKIVELHYVISMDFRNGKMPRSICRDQHCQSHAFDAINRILGLKLIKKRVK